MINVKEMVYEALCTVHDNVTDSWPQDWKDTPVIVYTEEENKSYERSGARTYKSYCRYRIDIFSRKSTSELAGLVDGILTWNSEGTGLGMTRTGCMDDNEGHHRHKIMRFECIVGENDGTIYGIDGAGKGGM